MNKYFKYILMSGMFFTALGMTSCNDYLDRDEATIVNSEEAFKNFFNFQGFTEELYYCIPLFHGNYWQSDFNWGEDEIIVAGSTWFMGYKIDNGDFWGWQKEYDGWGANWMDGTGTTTNDDRMQKRMWPLMWYGIRKANLGIANLDKLTDATQEEKNLIEGQLYFFRGWFHFMLMQYFGGLPYIDHVLDVDKTSYELPRLNYQQTADKAAADFQHAAELLPWDWDDTDAGMRTIGKNRQRINKVMALGYLGKNYLWAGSPLMNYESTGKKEYNKDYCIKAAMAFAELLHECKSENGNVDYDLVDFKPIGDDQNSGYSSIFYTWNASGKLPGGNEVIFSAPCYDGGATRWGMSLQYCPGALQDGSSNCFSPTANYVNYYGMANGLPIKEDGAGPDDGYLDDSGFNVNQPWLGRDPRFYHDIVYDGVKCIQGSTQKRENERYANLYTGGSYRNDDTGSRTGYLLYKFLPHPYQVNNDDFGQDKSHIVSISYMRLADVYLMYAEAAANGYGPQSGVPGFNLTAEGAINKIRDRAGVGHVADRFLGNTEDFMKEVRRERAVELAFEGHRFNDLRRWMLLTERPYTYKTKHNFDRAGELNIEESQYNKVNNFEEEIILERNFEPKHYWMPLKRVDTSIYLEFEQNPGW